MYTRIEKFVFYEWNVLTNDIYEKKKYEKLLLREEFFFLGKKVIPSRCKKKKINKH